MNPHFNHALEALYFGFQALTRSPDEKLAEVGLSRIHHRILYFIARHPHIRVGELLNTMKVSKQYLHAPLKKLIQMGWVQSITDPADKRAKQLILTPQGATIEQQLTQLQHQRLQKTLEQVGEEKFNTWIEVMEKIAQS